MSDTARDLQPGPADVIFNPEPGDDPTPGPRPRPGGPFDDPIVLTGPIGDKYKQLGGKKWGVPIHFPQDLTGGGRYVGFRGPANSGPFVKAIVHHPRTGAHHVGKAIFERWVHYRGHGSLGYPTSDPLTTHDGQGSYQTFESSVFVLHAATGAHEVHGDIQTRYAALGGSAYGYPSTDETITPDGRGRFNHFLVPASGAESSIYWTPETGAWEVFGLIRGAWAAAGWERGPVGYPTSGELVTHDGVGRYQTFEQGIYVWHPSTGAFSVQGAILDRYGQLGGSAWGYPITDEGDAAGPGRFNHFRHVDSGELRSIYWTPDTGAVEVGGDIRARWESMGWEGSSLGFPTAPATAFPEGGAGAMQQAFQGGRMLRLDANHVGPDPLVFYKTINATGVRGEARITVPFGGKAHFNGFVRAVKQDSYDFVVTALAKTPSNVALVFSDKGHIAGDFEPGPERHNFEQFSEHEIPASGYWELQNATYEVNRIYDSTIFGAVGDLVEGALKWIAGATLVATPGGALLLLGGTTAVTVLAGGSVASGMRIVSGTMWLAGPFGTMIAVAADALARLMENERPLHESEYAFVKRVFGESLPARTDIRISDAIGGGNRPFTYPRFDGKMVISVGKDDYADPLRYGVDEGTKAYGELLVHEMTHVWQYHNNAAAISYVADAIWARIRDDYEPGEVLDEPWDWFGLEEQGSIVDEWFKRHYNGPGSVEADGTTPRTPTPDTNFGLDGQAAMADQAYPFIRDNIRQGRN